MSGCSLPSNCSAEGVTTGYFPVENQMNPFAPSFGIHGDKPGCLRSVRLYKKNQQPGEQEMRGNSQSPRSITSVVIARPIAEIDS
jgi:hypothetical protein